MLGERVKAQQPDTPAKPTDVKHVHSTAEKAQVLVTSVLEKIFRSVSKHRVRVKQFLEEHDKLRKGYITRNKFESALNSAKILLTSAEVESLCKEYFYEDETISNMVNYKVFCNVLDSFRMQKHVHTMTESNEASESISAIKEMVHLRNVSATPFFQDFDKLRHGKVTSTQFGAVLDKLKLTSNSKVCIPALIKAFAETDGSVNYTTFCAMIE